MKTAGKRLLAVLAALVCMGLLCAAGLSAAGKTVRMYRYLHTDNGNHIFIDSQGGPTVMRGPKGEDLLFRGLETGDRVLVLCGAATEAIYPGRNVAYWCLRLGKGTAANLPADTLEQLASLGWLSGTQICTGIH